MDDLINSFFLNVLSFNEYVHSKKSIQILKKICSQKDGFNIILHGHDGSGKTSMLKTFIKTFYDKISLKHDMYEYKHKTKNYSFMYYYNFNITLFDFRLIHHQDYMIDFLNDLKNINEIPMYVVLKHSELMDNNLVSSLRPCIEKLNKKNIYFLFSTNKTNNFIEPIKSRCIILNLEYIQQKHISDIFKKYNIKLTKYYEKKLYNEFHPNLKNIIFNGIKNKIFEEKIKKINYEKEINLIIKKIKKNEKCLMEKITEILYQIIKKNNVNIFLEDFLKHLLENEEYKKKEDYIELFSNVDNNIIKSTNPIYVLQNMLLELKELL